MSEPRTPGVSELFRHLTLAATLSALLLLQVKTALATGVTLNAEWPLAILLMTFMLVVYGMLPVLRYVGKLTMQIIERQYSGGERT